MKEKKRIQHIITVVVLMLAASTVFAQNSPKPSPPQPNSKSIGQPENEVYQKVDVLPSFPGGITAFSSYLGKNIKYPADDKKNKLTGRAIIQFIVERDGSISDVKAMRSPSKAMSDEAIRVLSMSPKWNPGSINGKPVRAEFTVPINFSLPG